MLVYCNSSVDGCNMLVNLLKWHHLTLFLETQRDSVRYDDTIELYYTCYFLMFCTSYHTPPTTVVASRSSLVTFGSAFGCSRSRCKWRFTHTTFNYIPFSDRLT